MYKRVVRKREREGTRKGRIVVTLGPAWLLCFDAKNVRKAIGLVFPLWTSWLKVCCARPDKITSAGISSVVPSLALLIFSRHYKQC